MRKICEICKAEFEAREDFHKRCPTCFKTGRSFVAKDALSGLLLNSYYSDNGNPLKTLYLDVPKKLAELFSKDRPPLGTKQLRDFLTTILRARNKSILKGIDAARPLLYKCEVELEYQRKRDIIPRSFLDFMKHHLMLAERDDRSLDAFCQHLDSILCYFPAQKEKGGYKNEVA